MSKVQSSFLCGSKRFLAATACIAWSLATAAQTPAAPTPAAPVEGSGPKGQVILERHGAAAEPAIAAQTPAAPPEGAVPDINDAERSALRFTAYDLDARLVPASSGLTMRARVTVRNVSSSPLTHLALQVSSSMKWESVTLVDGTKRMHLDLAQHLLDTDADHTGKANEAVITLPAGLAPDASMVLDTFYSGTVVQDATRLERLGATPATALDTDWDVIGPSGTAQTSTALRGFGDVLWYPVSAPQLFLGQGAQLFDAAGKMKLAGLTTSVHLRLAVDYLGDPPAAAYFCGRRRPLTAVSDNADVPVVSSPGVATADFPETVLGFRAMSLFVIDSPETLLPPARVATSTDPSLAVETTDDAALPLLQASAKDAAVVLQEWLGLQPLTSLAVLDHAGPPFEDGPLLVAPLRALTAADGSSALTYGLSHAWLDTGSPWFDEGLAEFFVLLSVERTKGREVAETQLAALLEPLALGEIAPVGVTANTVAKTGPEAQPLPDAWSDMFYRRKAAGVWWMLRDLAGDSPLKLALEAWRVRPASRNTPDQDALIFEGLLEKISGKDLHWFFDDWVLHDRGLPDLSIAEVTPRELVSSTGRKTGWLVAVTVRNDGAAAADVPLVVHADSLSATQRIRVPGFSTATQRVLIEAAPTEVVLNDGTTPEQRVSRHAKAIVLHGRSD